MAEIFYNGKIYVGALSKHEYENVFNEGSDKLWVDYLNEIPDIRKYPVTGTHSFKDGQDVTGLYKLEHQLRSYNPDKEEWYKPAYLEDFHTATAGKRIVSIPNPPPDELDKDAKVNGMDELKIYRFQALHIEDTFRIVANILKSRSKETCIDRQICKSIEMINGILNKR